MLDANIIRENPDMIREMIRNRRKDEKWLDQFLEADGKWRALTEEGNRLRKKRNDVSMQISKMPKGEEKDARIAEMREVSNRIAEIDIALAKAAHVCPNTVRNNLAEPESTDVFRRAIPVYILLLSFSTYIFASDSYSLYSSL